MIVFLWLVATDVFAAGNPDTLTATQGIHPRGKFLSNRVKIGLPVRYALSLKHPRAQTVIFPDTAYNYAPFELVDKTYFPTRTDASGSLDSVIYHLVTFKIDSVQRLRLPVYLVQGKDCTAVSAAYDSVRLQYLILTAPDKLSPKISAPYRPVQAYADYSIFLQILGIAGILSFLLFVVFGKRLRRELRLFRMGREHASFSYTFERISRQLGQEHSSNSVENAVILWKRYMESLEDKPFSTYTTKEIVELFPSEQLAEALQQTDRIIYGQNTSAASVSFAGVLASVAHRTYVEKSCKLRKKSGNAAKPGAACM